MRIKIIPIMLASMVVLSLNGIHDSQVRVKKKYCKGIAKIALGATWFLLGYKSNPLIFGRYGIRAWKGLNDTFKESQVPSSSNSYDLQLLTRTKKLAIIALWLGPSSYLTYDGLRDIGAVKKMKEYAHRLCKYIKSKL